MRQAFKNNKQEIVQGHLTPVTIKKVMRYRWVMFGVITLVGFFVQFHRTSSGVIRADLSETFTMSATSFSLFSSMYFYPYVLMQLPAGILVDKWGVRKTIVLSSFITTFGTFIFSIAPTFGIACVGRALVGIGVAPPVIAMNKLIADWFKQSEVVSVIGLSNLFSTSGAMISQTPLALLIGILTWRTTFKIFSGITFIVSLACLLLLYDTPERIGLPSVASIGGSSPTMKPIEIRQSTGAIIKNVIFNHYCWPLFLIMPSLMGAYTLFSGTWGVPYLQDVYGYSNVQASTFTLYMAIGMSFSSFAISFISDRICSRKKPLIFITGLTFVLWMMITFYYSFLKYIGSVGMSIIMFLFGCTASAVPMLFAIVREVNNPTYIGISIGVMNTIGMLASAVFPIICGSILDTKATMIDGANLYQSAFLFIVILTGCSFIASIFVKETSARYITPPDRCKA